VKLLIICLSSLSRFGAFTKIKPVRKLLCVGAVWIGPSCAPGLLTKGPARGLSAVRAFTGSAGVKAGQISRADVAAFCLHELVGRSFVGRAPLITY
jgi:hypothetical protein